MKPIKPSKRKLTSKPTPKNVYTQKTTTGYNARLERHNMYKDYTKFFNSEVKKGKDPMKMNHKKWFNDRGYVDGGSRKLKK